MSQRDLRRVFQVHTHDEVPEYDVVHLRVLPSPTRSKRSTEFHSDDDLLASESKRIYLKAFGEDVHLNLKPNQEFNERLKSLRLFTAESRPGGVGLEYIDNGPVDLESIGETYHDDSAMAAVVVRQSPSGSLLLDGTIGNELVIRPVPSQVLPPLPLTSSSSSLPVDGDDASQVSPSSSETAAFTSSRDDDEMFLEDEDDVAVPELNHLKSRSSKSNSKERSININNNKKQSNKRTSSNRNDAMNSMASSDNNKKESRKSSKKRKHQEYKNNNDTTPVVTNEQSGESSRQQADQVEIGESSSDNEKSVVHLSSFSSSSSVNLTSPSPSNEPKTSTTKRSRRSPPTPPTLSSKSDDNSDNSPLYHSHAHFVFKKKSHHPHDSSPLEDDSREDISRSQSASQSQKDKDDSHHHFDFAVLEPGHLTFSPSNWTLVPSSSSFFEDNAHRLYSIISRNNANNNETAFSTPFSDGHHHHHRRRTKRQSPDTVWPEVLLVVDYDSYILHGGNSRDVKRYFISFWNGVDLRYKLLSHPRIRVSLAGMIVAKDRDATPYLERNRLRAPNADAVDAAGALTDMGKYLYREDRLPTYDLAVVITKLDMCRRRYEGGRCNRGTAGFAYVGGACVVNKRLEKVNSVAIIEDSGGFSGIIVAAHEVGHLLGCVHDGSPPPSYLGGPGATRCPWEDGFIMSDLRHTERGFRWSSCSVEQFKHFLNGETATCLYNYPHENQLLPRVLPGTMLTLDEQCKRDRGTNACFKDARVCAQLFCFDSASGYCVSYRPAAEGSSCGDGQVCRNGKCAAELENIIPDYTHVTQTVVSQGGHPPDHLLSRSDSFPTSVGPPLPPSALTVDGGFDVLNDGPPPPPLNHQSFNSPSPSRGGRSFHGGDSDSFNSQPPPSHIVVTSGAQRKKSSSCRDIIDKLAGSLSCGDFLERFGYRYCNHSYIKRNCCASHAIICNKSAK